MDSELSARLSMLPISNDMDLLASSKVGRDINRHYYTPNEAAAALEKPVVRRLCNLARFRNEHPAFGGDFAVEQPSASRLVLTWIQGDDKATLAVDFAAKSATISRTGGEPIIVA